MDGKIDAIVAGVGTGGTITGVGKYIKEKSPATQIVGVDPIGSVYYDLFKTGTMTTPHVYKVEGIGEDMVCGALDMSVIDDMIQVNDKDCFRMTRRLAREEGLFVGGSSGAAAHAAVQVARTMGPGKRVVVIFPDHGDRYLSKLYNDEWMRVNGFLEEDDGPVAETILARKSTDVIWAKATDTLIAVSALLKDNNISQVPVMNEEGFLSGSVSERKILTAMVTGTGPGDPVSKIAEGKLPVVHPKTSINKINELLLSHGALLVGTSERTADIVGILSRIDIIEYLQQVRCS